MDGTGPIKVFPIFRTIFLKKIIANNLRKHWVLFYSIRTAFKGADLLP
jgi:hypothetical protein